MNGQAALWAACVAAEGAALVMALRRAGCGFRPRLQHRASVAKSGADSVHAEGKPETSSSSTSNEAAKQEAPLPGHKTGPRSLGARAVIKSVLDSDLAPVVLLLAAAVVIDLVVIAGQCAVLQGPRTVLPWASRVCAASPAARPFAGLARAVYHVESALVMAWPLALAWACWRVFVATKGERPRSLRSVIPLSSCPAGAEDFRSPDLVSDVASTMRPLAGPVKPLDVLAAVYVGTVASLVSLHPLGATSTQAFLLAWEVVALAFAAVAIVLGWRRAVRGQAAWTVAHGVLLVLVPVEAAVCAIGPFARPSVFSAWEVARWQYLAAFAIVAGMLARRPRTESGRA